MKKNAKMGTLQTSSWLALAALILTFSANSHAEGKVGKAAENWRNRYVPHANDKMPYRLMKPLRFDANQKYSLIVSLHGAGGRGTDNRKQLKSWNKSLAEKQNRTDYPCYVLAPQADRLWDKTHFKEIKRIIAALPSVDMNRIYIMGHSMGGHGTYIMIQLEPGYFAAAAPSAGSGRGRTKPFITASVIKDVPIWAFHGDKDRICPIERTSSVGRNENSASSSVSTVALMLVVVMSFRALSDCTTGPVCADVASGQDSERAMAAARRRFVMCFPWR